MYYFHTTEPPPLVQYLLELTPLVNQFFSSHIKNRTLNYEAISTDAIKRLLTDPGLCTTTATPLYLPTLNLLVSMYLIHFLPGRLLRPTPFFISAPTVQSKKA